MNNIISKKKKKKKKTKPLGLETRQDWGDVNPIQKFVPNKKKFNKKQQRQKDKRNYGSSFEDQLGALLTQNIDDPFEIYCDRVKNCLCNIIMEENHISEKSFDDVDKALTKSSELVYDFVFVVEKCLDDDTRPSLCAEQIYFDSINDRLFSSRSVSAHIKQTIKTIIK